MKAVSYEIVETLNGSITLYTEGIVLECGELEVVLGGDRADIFKNVSIVDHVSLHMTSIIYELLGYLAPEVRYTAVNSIPTGTSLCRVMHVQGESRNPVYAVNMTPVRFNGYWRDIDMSRPSSLSPTLELMGIASDQQISLNNQRTALDNIHLLTVNMCELSRIGSALEPVMGKKGFTTLPPEPVVDRFKVIVSEYRNDPVNFIRIMTLARGALALAFWIFLTVNDNDLIFGNLSPGIVDRFVESLGVSPDLKAIQMLEVRQYHHESPSVQAFNSYFESHRVSPFFIEWKNVVQDAILNKGCECLSSVVKTR